MAPIDQSVRCPKFDPVHGPALAGAQSARRGSTMRLGITVLTACWLFAACSQEEMAAPPPPPIEQVPARIEEAFQGVPAEVSAVVQETVTSVQADDPAALTKLQELGLRPDLTPAQRAAANQAMYAVLARVNAAATNGNAKAAEALQRYQSAK